MTGYGAGEGPVAGGRLRIEVRTVNHRYFNLSAKLPVGLSALEIPLRERLRRDFDRGHVTVGMRWIAPPTDETGDGNIALNLQRARAVVARLRELQTTLGIGGELDVGLVARQPDVLVAADTGSQAVEWDQVEPVVAEAVAECKAMRHREGEVLVAELLAWLAVMERLLDEVERRAPTRLVAERERLRQSVAALLESRNVAEERLDMEIALLADKLDITEEIVRLRSHLVAARETLAGAEPMGKRLGFLAQEMGREINTIGSKANDAEIAARVIDLKGALEKFREQLENLE